MSGHVLGIVTNGVTGRMGYQQHLDRSVLAQWEQFVRPVVDGAPNPDLLAEARGVHLAEAGLRASRRGVRIEVAELVA